MDELHRPHDKFIKKCFSDKANAKSFFLEYFPKEIVELLDFENLELEKDSFLDSDLKEYFSDLLFKVKIKENYSYVYILFEHKSYREKNLYLQLLSYMLRIWEKVRQKEKDAKLPLIIPFVFYHGRSKLKDFARFSSEFDTSEFDCNARDILDKFIPDFEYILMDVARLDDRQIRGEILVQVVLLITKYIFSKNLGHKLEEAFSLLLGLLNQETMIEYLELILKYLFATAPTSNISKEELEVIVKKAFSKKGDEMLETIGDVLRKQGIEQGIEQGLILGKKEGISLGRKEGISLGKKEGISLGKEKGKYETLMENVIKMYRKNLSEKEISELLDIDIELVNKFVQNAN